MHSSNWWHQQGHSAKTAPMCQSKSYLGRHNWAALEQWNQWRQIRTSTDPTSKINPKYGQVHQRENV